MQRLKSQQVQSQERRKAMRRAIQEVSENPEVAAKLQKFNREREGRPNLEVDQPFLHEIILRIASMAGAADGRRRSETVRCCRTLDDLAEAVKEKGFKLSRSGLYLR